MPRRTTNAPERQHLRQAFSLTIRTLRGKIGVSQEELAGLCGLDRTYMSALERGSHTPTIETIYKFLPTLDVSFAEFAVAFEASLRKVTRRKPEP